MVYKRGLNLYHIVYELARHIKRETKLRAALELRSHDQNVHRQTYYRICRPVQKITELCFAGKILSTFLKHFQNFFDIAFVSNADPF